MQALPLPLAGCGAGLRPALPAVEPASRLPAFAQQPNREVPAPNRDRQGADSASPSESIENIFSPIFFPFPKPAPSFLGSLIRK